MAYEEPGVQVIQQLQAAAANVQASEQALTIIGEMYEVFTDEVHPVAYDPLTGAGAQSFTWPGKKTSSVVDLAGVRKSIAEVDSQLNAQSPFPMSWSLRDPDSGKITAIDELTSIESIDQADFSVIEGLGEARASGAVATAAQSNQMHLAAGGLLALGVVTGDRVGVTIAGIAALGNVDVTYDDRVFFTPDGFSGLVKTASIAGDLVLEVTMSAAQAQALPASGTVVVGQGDTREIVTYSAVVVTGLDHVFTVSAMVNAHAQGEAAVVAFVQTPATTLADVDMVATPGFLTSVSTPFAGKEGDHVAIWTEAQRVNDGVIDAADGNVLTSASAILSAADVGGKIAIWEPPASATVDGDLNAVPGSLSSATGGFTSADVGKIIDIAGSMRKVISVTSSTVLVYSGTALTGTGVSFEIYSRNDRVIVAYDAATGAVVFDGAALTTGQTALPVVVYSAVYRDLVTDPGNTSLAIRHSGQALSLAGDASYGVLVEVFTADLVYKIAPDYELLCTYRALDISSVNGILGVYKSNDLTAIGQIDKANPLLWAASSALTAMGTTDTRILLLPVDLYADAASGSKTGYPEDHNEALAYNDAIIILDANDGVYHMVPLTRNSSVRAAFISHALAASEPCNKSERVAWLTYDLIMGDMESDTGVIEPGLDGGNKLIIDTGAKFLSIHKIIPGNSVVITAPATMAGDYVVAAGSTEDQLVLEGENWLQSSGSFTSEAKEFTVTDGDFDAVAGEVTTAVSEAWKDVEVNDYVLVGTETRKITAVSNGYKTLAYAGVAIVGTGVTTSILRSSQGVSFYARPLGKDAQAQAMAKISSTIASRRAVHLWPDSVEQVTGSDALGNEVREFLPSYFAAAAEAGRVAVLPPERSSTGAALQGPTALEHSNFYFSRAQMNVIAAGGWAMLEQRAQGAAVEMRHLLTTDMSTVKNQELSFTKNVDNQAKVLRKSLEPLLNDDKGRVNITTQFLAAMMFPVQGVMESFVSNNQLVKTASAPPYRILDIRQDTTAPDTILIDAETNQPLPANKAVVTYSI